MTSRTNVILQQKISNEDTESWTYRADIDGLRGFAVLAVVIYHLDPRFLPGGFVGVDIFFAISGFLITSIVWNNLTKGTFSLNTFYQRRISRLIPAFYLMLAFAICFSAYIYSSQNFSSAGAGLVAAVFSAANLKFLTQGSYFQQSPDAQLFLHCWSLSVEEQFYLLFPLTLMILHKTFRQHATAILALLCGISLVACVATTIRHPQWAFFLLPTRAWELLSGALVALLGHRLRPTMLQKRVLPIAGILLVALSVGLIEAQQAFPGYLAIAPIAGSLCILWPTTGPESIVTKLLSSQIIVWIGRLSYSLYLWHWPVFSLIDYYYYSSTNLARMALKLSIAIACTLACYYWIERPARAFLSRPLSQKKAYALVLFGIILFAPAGWYIHNTQYVDSTTGSALLGGLEFHSENSNHGSIVLMGDSTASMYGKMIVELTKTFGKRLFVISVAGQDPLPGTGALQPKLWTDGERFVSTQKPEVIILVCNWVSKLSNDTERLTRAVSVLQKHAGKLILITQVPELPGNANRDSIRNGSRPPFFEEASQRQRREAVNGFIKSFDGIGRTKVLDAEHLFINPDGSIRFADENGKEYYHNSGHLSGLGAKLVEPHLLELVTQVPGK